MYKSDIQFIRDKYRELAEENNQLRDENRILREEKKILQKAVEILTAKIKKEKPLDDNEAD